MWPFNMRFPVRDGRLPMTRVCAARIAPLSFRTLESCVTAPEKTGRTLRSRCRRRGQALAVAHRNCDHGLRMWRGRWPGRVYVDLPMVGNDVGTSTSRRCPGSPQQPLRSASPAAKAEAGVLTADVEAGVTSATFKIPVNVSVPGNNTSQKSGDQRRPPDGHAPVSIHA